MKRSLPIIAVLPVLLCQCESPIVIPPPPPVSSVEAPATPSLPDPRQRLNDENRAAYDDGLQEGQQDFARGLPPNYARHVGNFDPTAENAYSVGYEAGYSRASR